MAHLLTDELWGEVRPLFPPHKPRPRGGRPPVDDRVALAGILFVLKTGIGILREPTAINTAGGVTPDAPSSRHRPTSPRPDGGRRCASRSRLTGPPAALPSTSARWARQRRWRRRRG